MVTRKMNNLADRNKMIQDIHRAFPYWSQQAIADLVGVTRQRVSKILKSNGNRVTMIDNMVTNIEIMNIGNIPISATQVSKKYGIPYGVIAMWVKRGFVKVVSHPGHAAPGKFVLLDPVSLQDRINQYKPKKKQK